MKGNQKLIDVLNQLLADELTAINQYMVHSELCSNWGYERLHKVIEKRAVGEMSTPRNSSRASCSWKGRPW